MIFKNVVAISPHTDDAELGAGGTINKLIESGSNIEIMIFSVPNERLRQESKLALDELGINASIYYDFTVRRFPAERQEILQKMYDYNKSNKVDLVLTPSTYDLHQDHKTVTEEVLRAFKNCTILGYELPWNNISFHENCFVPLKRKHVEKKISALWNYKTQLDKLYFNKEYLRGLLRARGIHIGEKYAEGFEAIKIIYDNFRI